MHTAVPSAGDSDPEPLQIDIGIKEVAALTTEEKLQHFEDICTGDALKKYEQAVSDYTAYEEKILNEHKENARKQAALQIAAEKERRVDPDRHLPLYRGGPGPCEANAALWFFFIFRHVSGRRLCDPALLGPSCGTRPHGTAVCPIALRHGLRDSVYLRPCLHLRVLLRKRKSLRPRCRPAF